MSEKLGWLDLVGMAKAGEYPFHLPTLSVELDAIPAAMEINAGLRDGLPQSPWLCPVCNDAHYQELEMTGRLGEDTRCVMTCARGHRYQWPARSV